MLNLILYVDVIILNLNIWKHKMSKYTWREIHRRSIHQPITIKNWVIFIIRIESYHPLRWCSSFLSIFNYTLLKSKRTFWMSYYPHWGVFLLILICWMSKSREKTNLISIGYVFYKVYINLFRPWRSKEYHHCCGQSNSLKR